jgi:hypothetical protein
MTVRPELRPALRWHSGPLPRVFMRTLGCHRRTHSPVFRVRSYGNVVTRLACASASNRPRPPRRCRINRPAKALRAGPVLVVFTHTTGPTRPVPRACTECSDAMVSRRCRAPLLRFPVPFSVRWPRSRPHVRRRHPPGRSRFDLSSCRTALVHGPAGTTWPLRVFAFGGHVAMKLVWRPCGAGVGTESVAHVASRPRPALRRAARITAGHGDG